MKKFMLTMALAGLVAAAGFSRAEAADARAKAVAAPDEKVTNGYDLKPQALLDLKQLQKKFTDLAGAIPQDKYTWRPGPGVRSVSETFLHVTQANYFILSFLGIPRPAGTDAKDFETSTMDKAKIIDELNKSFAFAEDQVEKLTNADLAKSLPKMGPDANEGDVVYLLVTHCHEHLGQMIAYARVNSVVPPWTAA
ncbi:MAG TPA: DinB family protein, partial [Candidatus Acidoferrum sp.]|nr:DinB family protein [Candidatus Acidoferrum sp.]